MRIESKFCLLCLRTLMAGWCVASFLLLVMTAWADTDTANPWVKFSQGRLSVRAVDVPLKDLVTEIKNKSGIVLDIRDEKAAGKRINVDFVNLMPAFALGEILRGLNFASWYDNGRLSQALVLSPEEPRSPKLVMSAPPPSRLQPTVAPAPRQNFEALLKRNRDEGMKAIAQALKGNIRVEKLRAVDALESDEHPEALKLLGEALADSDVAVKKSALEILADKNTPGVIPLLAAGLHDPDPSMREDVLEALSQKGEVQLLHAALSDPDHDVREKAQQLLTGGRRVNEARR